MPIEIPIYRVSYKYADDPEDNQTKLLNRAEILFHWPELNFLLSNDDFYSVKWVVDLAEVTIVRVIEAEGDSVEEPTVKAIEVDELIKDLDKESFETALERFMTTAQNVVDEHMNQFPGQFKRLTLMRGKRYIRIVAETGMEHLSYKSGEVTFQRSAWGFIDMTNGDILKAATWKAPAKHARGNIYNAEYTLTPYGPPYLR